MFLDVEDEPAAALQRSERNGRLDVDANDGGIKMVMSVPAAGIAWLKNMMWKK